MIPGVCVVLGFCANSLKLQEECAPSMESKMYGTRKENKGFQMCAVLGFLRKLAEMAQSVGPQYGEQNVWNS